jgi:hypothetical protein
MCYLNVYCIVDTISIVYLLISFHIFYVDVSIRAPALFGRFYVLLVPPVPLVLRCQYSYLDIFSIIYIYM